MCGADRKNGERGFCGETSEIRVARAALHMWEEPCISGTRGSGTVFFTGCVLRCAYCQNGNIACGNTGKVISIDRLAEIFIEQQERGAHNINLVTPTHFVPQIREAIIKAKEKGLVLPIVYNTGSYENVDTLKMLDGLVDIYLPDLKYYSSELSKKYSEAHNYFEVATAAIAEMVRQVGTPEFDDEGIMTKGVIVRHLLLPGCTEDSKRIIKYLYDTYGDDIYVSIMNQYTPFEFISDEYPELKRRVTKMEYNSVVNLAAELGINGFTQQKSSASQEYVPDFDLSGI
jgi:putative pyruvate formate lyase activating enzyme